MSHNSIGKQAGYDGSNVEFIAKNLVCETLNGTAVPAGGLSQTLDEVCTGGTNNVTVRQVIANGLVSSNGRVFLQQQPLPAGTQLSNIMTFASGELKTQTLTKEAVLPNGLQSVCDIQNNTTTAIVGNGLQSTSTISASTTVQAGTALQVTTKPTTIPIPATNPEVLVWDNNIIKSVLLYGAIRKPTSLYGETGFLIDGISSPTTYAMINASAYSMKFGANFTDGGIHIETMKVGYNSPLFNTPSRSGYFYMSGELITGFECQNYTLDLSVSQIWNPDFPQSTPPENTTNYFFPVNYQIAECGDNSGGNATLNRYLIQLRLSEDAINAWEQLNNPNITNVYKFRFTLRKI